MTGTNKHLLAVVVANHGNGHLIGQAVQLDVASPSVKILKQPIFVLFKDFWLNQLLYIFEW